MPAGAQHGLELHRERHGRYCGLHLESSEAAAAGLEASWEAGGVVAAEVLEGHFSDDYEDRYWAGSAPY